MLPAVGRSRPRMVRARVVFPEPDSPTTATTSRASTSRSTPSTARAIGLPRAPNSTTRSRTLSSGPVTVVLPYEYAGHRPVRAGHPDRRIVPRTLRQGDRTAWMERTARGQLLRVRRVAGQTGRSVAGLRVADPGERRRQGAGVRMFGMPEDFV